MKITTQDRVSPPLKKQNPGPLTKKSNNEKKEAGIINSNHCTWVPRLWEFHLYDRGCPDEHWERTELTSPRKPMRNTHSCKI